jgi:RHS repeat-associated protein
MRFLFLILALAVQQTAGVYAADVPLHEWREIHHPDYEEDRGYFTDITKQPMTTWLFEEGTFVPAAKLTKTEKLSIVTNYMGTPEAMYREDGEAVWTCELNSYGKVRNFQGGSKTDCPFRYQGQYEDSETGLYYNRFRYYSPEEGVYISQDPIGIEGCLNLYAYIYNTYAIVDIFGLAPVRYVNGVPIYGTGQTTGVGHADISEKIANQLATSGQFSEVHLNRSYEAITGVTTTPRRSPDVVAVGKDGRVHAIEVASDLDMRSQTNLNKLTIRNQIAQGQLPENMRGQIIIIEKPYDIDDINSKINSLCDS